MGEAAIKIEKKAVRATSSLVNFIVLVVVTLLAVFSCYALWDSNQVYNAADAAQYEIYKPIPEAEGGPTFGELQAINPEVFAWLTVYGTNIDYPVTQSADNWKYVNTNALGNYSLSGSIFLDYENSPDFTDFNSIFYGHHMERQAMFGEIGLFTNESFFKERLHGNLYYGGENHGLEFFAFLHVDAYDTSVFAAAIQGNELQQGYLENLLEKAKFTRDIGITSSDRIVLLSTCSAESTNGRDILVARVTDEVYDDTFITQETGSAGTHKRVDKQAGIWAGIPLWIGGSLLALLVFLVLAIALVNRKKKKRRKELYQKAIEQKNMYRKAYRGRSDGMRGNNRFENTDDR